MLPELLGVYFFFDTFNEGNGNVDQAGDFIVGEFGVGKEVFYIFFLFNSSSGIFPSKSDVFAASTTRAKGVLAFFQFFVSEVRDGKGIVFIYQPGSHEFVFKLVRHPLSILPRENSHRCYRLPVAVKDPIKVPEHPLRKLQAFICLTLDFDMSEYPFFLTIFTEYFYQLINQPGGRFLFWFWIHFS